MVWYVIMKRTWSILLVCLAVPYWACAAPRSPAADTDKRTASGVIVRYRAGTRHHPGGFEFVRDLDRELTRIFRAPGGAGACVVLVDRAHPVGPVTSSVRGRVREIRLPENFVSRENDPAFRAELAAHILAARFGLPGECRPLPGWIGLGLEGLRRNSLSAGRLVRDQQNYPVLRGLLGAGYLPDFRALMRLKKCDFTGSAYPAACEFSRFLLEAFRRASTLKHNALGDYTAGMLRGDLPEAQLYRTFLLPALTGRRRNAAAVNEAEAFRQAAEQAAFNFRTPRPAAELLKLLPDILRFTVAGPNGKPVSGDAAMIPDMLHEKHPSAYAARQTIQYRIQQYARMFSPELQGASGELLNAVVRMDGKEPEKERAALARARNALEIRLAEWARVEAFLEECERKYVNPCLLFRPELSTVSEPDEFLSEAEKAFFDEIEKKYLEN